MTWRSKDAKSRSASISNIASRMRQPQAGGEQWNLSSANDQNRECAEMKDLVGGTSDDEAYQFGVATRTQDDDGRAR